MLHINHILVFPRPLYVISLGQWAHNTMQLANDVPYNDLISNLRIIWGESNLSHLVCCSGANQHLPQCSWWQCHSNQGSIPCLAEKQSEFVEGGCHTNHVAVDSVLRPWTKFAGQWKAVPLHVMHGAGPLQGKWMVHAVPSCEPDSWQVQLTSQVFQMFGLPHQCWCVVWRDHRTDGWWWFQHKTYEGKEGWFLDPSCKDRQIQQSSWLGDMQGPRL